ncbi:MAG: hypothetical protein JWO36_5972, partial [Myxococcales bacterium]|nr:hypothetical protein [Myxococcales bacterium]
MRSRRRASPSPPTPAELTEHVDAVAILWRRERFDRDRRLPCAVVPPERRESPRPDPAESSISIRHHELELGAERARTGKCEARSGSRAGPHVIADAIAPQLAGECARATIVELQLRARDDL